MKATRRYKVKSSHPVNATTTSIASITSSNDPEKTAKTVRVIDGSRWVFPGDYATVETDGTLTLLGRGSMCINTAGEKVFPEEVEEALKSHHGVKDCLVVGLPDERFGETVVAVASSNAEVSEGRLIEFCHDQIAGYKVPKRILLVERVHRAPNGKADYKWAKETARALLDDSERSHFTR